ncbi:MAG: fatty acid desaturase [Deltaproteobacteria bacterium]|nr:fatty acid desaturase [Deltaproteobacteria bacterium]
MIESLRRGESDAGGNPRMVSAKREEALQDDWLETLEKAGRPLADTSDTWRHNAINLACLALLIIGFPAAYLAFRNLPTPLMVPLLGLVYGSFIFSFFTLVVHEASHNMFLITGSPRLRRRLNDIGGWAICMLFLRDYGLHWRKGHLLHHRRTLEEDDPQNCSKYVLEGRALLVKLAKVWLIPFYEFEVYRLWMKDLNDRCPKPEGSSAPGWLRGAGFVLGWTAILIFPLSQAPIATLLTTLIAIKAATCLNFLKSSMEHGGGYRETSDQRLKTRGLTFPLMGLCFPFCITPYHWEHHLVPAIPWYRLPHFRKMIADRIPEDQREWIYTPGPELLRQVILP